MEILERILSEPTGKERGEMIRYTVIIRWRANSYMMDTLVGTDYGDSSGPTCLSFVLNLPKENSMTCHAVPSPRKYIVLV